MQIFDELNSRGVQDIFFMSMDGVSGLEDGAKSIFPKVIVQRCIIYFVRNELRYVPYKDDKEFSREMKKFYGAPSLKACQRAFETFQNRWSHDSGAVDSLETKFFSCRTTLGAW